MHYHPGQASLGHCKVPESSQPRSLIFLRVQGLVLNPSSTAYPACVMPAILHGFRYPYTNKNLFEQVTVHEPQIYRHDSAGQ